jgi:molybdenum cofactor cytidylyltransferase
VLITLLDQPLISGRHFKKMVELFQPGSEEIIVSRSRSGWQGVPVLFDRSYFEALRSLEGDEGARKILQEHPGRIRFVPCEDPPGDMDTPEAYERLRKLYGDGSGFN